ncbi:hypothetical protein AZE42_08932 [Rhizopogon vesiculosus]|uniref:Major facilitator superfamily (MFS) profile domain-containing protein n=1 Tax=Rhizopogon vesiculosus TaxID=180088 RepID=A0A1J8QKR9_9AGAM|nr:hypothetical protein AZE42_08932 [Rhizopogon vesiculosus]
MVAYRPQASILSCHSFKFSRQHLSKTSLQFLLVHSLYIHRCRPRSRPLIFEWDAPNDPRDPNKRKWAATVIVSSFTFIGVVSSAIVAPAAGQVASSFGVTTNVIVSLTTSIFVLAYGGDRAFIPRPTSEIYGRSRVLQLSGLWCLARNLACGFARIESQFLALLFLADLGASASMQIDGSVVDDCWRSGERENSPVMLSLTLLLGPVVGPITGTLIVEYSTRRWILFTSLEYFYSKRAKGIRRSMDAEKTQYKVICSVFGARDRSWHAIMAKGLIRPCALFVYEPIVQLLGIYVAFLDDIPPVFWTTMPSIFHGV